MARTTSAPNLPLSAPDLTGPVSILDWPTTYAGGKRRKSVRPLAHVRLEVDLQPEVVREPPLPILRQMEALLREREVVEVGDLLRLETELLHALASLGFQRVDHWEVIPGGWLPLPEPGHERLEEPLGHLLRALRSDAWKNIAEAKAFSVRLSGVAHYRVDATARRVHRERTPSLSLDLHGRFTEAEVRDVVGALTRRLPVLRSRISEFAHV